MRKMKKINGYLVVRFNDREKREYAGTGLGSYGVIDAELYTGILNVDRSVMEYDDAETLEIAVEQARGLEAELDVEEPEVKITVVIEGETEISEEEVEPENLFKEQQALLEIQLQSGRYIDLDPRTAAYELHGYTRALEDLGMINGHDERFMVKPDIFDAVVPPPLFGQQEEVLAYICNEVCKYREGSTQEELDAICEKCKVEQCINEKSVKSGGEHAESYQPWSNVAECGKWRLEVKLPEDVKPEALRETVNAVSRGEPPQEKFRHLPETGESFLTRNVYRLGLAIEAGCPSNDCTIYRSISRMARELDEALDGTQGYAAEVLQRKLKEHVRELLRMYHENYAVKTFRKEAGLAMSRGT